MLADQNDLLQMVTTRWKSIEDKSYLIAEILSSQRLQYVGNGKSEHYRDMLKSHNLTAPQIAQNIIKQFSNV